MKKIIVFVIIFVLAGCYVKGIRKKVPVQQVMLNGISLEKEMKTYTLEIPETWYSYRDVHGLIMHSPKVMQKRSDNFYRNNFYAFEYSFKETKAINIETLFEYYLKKKKEIYPNIVFTPKKMKHEKYGVFYLVKYGTSWSKVTLFTNIDVLFHYKNKNFELSYISENKYYDEFIKDVEGIIKSFTIKESI